MNGAVAQLGARLNGIQEVGSSILPSSTLKWRGELARVDPFFIYVLANTMVNSLNATPWELQGNELFFHTINSLLR